jgi:hypothetical protein
MDLLSTSASLIPRNKFRGFKVSEIYEVVKKYYPSDLSQQNIYKLQLEQKYLVKCNDVKLNSDFDFSNKSDVMQTYTALCSINIF